MINEVSLQYAKSLYELSTNLEQDLNDLKVLTNAILDSNELVKVLKHPSISKDEKKQIFKELLKEKISSYIKLSYTSISTFYKCQFYYYLERVLKIKFLMRFWQTQLKA